MAKLAEAAIAMVLLGVGGCGAARIEMSQAPGAFSGTLGPLQRCPAGGGVCTIDHQYDSSQYNSSNTTYYSMPTCPYGIQAVLVPAPGTSDALVLCAAPGQLTPPQADGGIPTAVAPLTTGASLTAALAPSR
jgi:hypothetical protein